MPDMKSLFAPMNNEDTESYRAVQEGWSWLDEQKADELPETSVLLGELDAAVLEKHGAQPEVRLSTWEEIAERAAEAKAKREEGRVEKKPSAKKTAYKK